MKTFNAQINIPLSPTIIDMIIKFTTDVVCEEFSYRYIHAYHLIHVCCITCTCIHAGTHMLGETWPVWTADVAGMAARERYP